MARTQYLPTSAETVKVWANKVVLDSVKKMATKNLIGEEGSAQPFITKSDLESGPGDEVTTTLIAKLRGKPIEGSEKGAGRAQKLSSATHAMRIDKHRQIVNVGDVMDQKRVNFSIADQVRDRLSDYMAEIQDEQLIMTASGARGIGPQGDEILHYPVGYLGFPNVFVAPDTNHILYGDGTRTTAAAMTSSDKLTTNTIDRLVLRAKKQVGGQPDKSVRMTPIDTDGGKHFVYLTGPESMYDLRREVGDAGWLTLEKAKATAVGAKSPIFQGGKAFYNGVVIDETQTVVKFDTTVAGGSYGVAAMRNLFLGANAVAIAFGSKTRKSDSTRFELMEDDDDYGEEGIIIVRMIAGFSKCRFNSMDFGVIASDVNYTAAA